MKQFFPSILNKDILIIVSFFFLGILGEATAKQTCEKINLLGWNTDFVNIYNTEEGVESPGDTWTWHANVTEDQEGKVHKGEITGFCTRVPAGFWECLETIMFAEGNIFCHYVQKPPATSSTAGITGGTEDYIHADGQIVFTAPTTDNGPWLIDMDLCTPSDETTSGSAGGRILQSNDMMIVLSTTAAAAAALLDLLEPNSLFLG